MGPAEPSPMGTGQETTLRPQVVQSRVEEGRKAFTHANADFAVQEGSFEAKQPWVRKYNAQRYP